MDVIDDEIIAILRTDGRRSFTELGRDVGLSTNAVAARVRKLESAGIIEGFVAVIADAFPDRGRIEAFVDVRLRDDQDSEDFLTRVRAVAGVGEAVHVTGPYDYLLRVRVEAMSDLDRLLRTLKRECGAAQTQTRIALDSSPRGPG